MKILNSLFCFTVLLAFYRARAVTEVQDKEEVIKAKPLQLNDQIQSCLDVLENGITKSGFYTITMDDGNSRTHYCDLCSEHGAAWTLVMSYSKKNSDMKEFLRSPLSQDAVLNAAIPNWKSYRLPRDEMFKISKKSTHWRFTCNFPDHNMNYKDYARALLSEMNPLTFNDSGTCVQMEYIDIRGHSCADCTAAWWQNSTQAEALHIDSSVHVKPCEFDARKGSIKSEDNFGYYVTANPKFRCSESELSTTNFWFGAYL